MAKKVLGIVGGMGPEASSYLYQKIIELSGADTDQDHLEIIIHNNTRIPDRTAAILDNKPSPVPEIQRSVKMLESAGAECIIMACITAHFFIDEIRNSATVPVLSAVDATVDQLKHDYPDVSLAGLLATAGTIRTGLFQKALVTHHVKPLVNDDAEVTDLVMGAIYGGNGIKAGNKSGAPKQKLYRAAHLLTERGAQALILGCTELPLVFDQRDFRVPLINPSELLAETAILFCNNE